MKRLLKCVVLAVGSGLLTTAAVSADLPQKGYAAPRLVAAAYDWSGVYMGGELGYGWGKATSNAYGLSASDNTDGAVYGLFLGAQRHFTSGLVLGAQVTYDWASMNGSGGISGLPKGVSSSSNAKLQNMLLAEGKLGYAMNTWLPYATIGGACAESHVNGSIGTVAASSNNFDKCGWTLGAGIDYAIWQNVVIGLKYNFVDLGTSNPSFPIGAGVGLSIPVTQNSINIVKASISAKW